MNAPVHAAFASILGSICPPAPKQPMVDGLCLCTVNYDGLLLDVYGDGEGYFSGIALKGRKEYLSGVMSLETIREIELLANQQMLLPT